MSPRDPHSRKCALRVGAPAPRPLMGVGFVRGVGPRTHAESVRVGHVWERGPICTACATRVPSAPSLLVAHGSFVSGAHPGCPGGNLPLLSAWRWPTEGAQGVLSCPLGITELSEPVSVDIYLHPYAYTSTKATHTHSCNAAEVLGRSAATAVYWSERREGHR